jgi:succinoglycan biosynthesis protein ExoA
MTYAPDFTKRCVEALRENAATSIDVYMQTVGRLCFQRAVAAAQNSKMGNGGAAHRSEGRSSGWVDHGHHAAFDRAFFQRLGGYGATLSPASVSDGWRSHLDGQPLCAGAAVLALRQGAALAHDALDKAEAAADGCRPSCSSWLLLVSCARASLVGSCRATSGIHCGLLVGVVFAVQCRDTCLLLVGPAAIIMHLSYGVGVFQTMLTLWWRR